MESMPARNIVLATDLSPRCDRAFDRALQLATQWSARLVVAHAIQSPLPVSDEPSWRKADPLAAARNRVVADIGGPSAVSIDVLVERGEPADLALAAAERPGCVLAVTGMARDEMLGRIQLGGTVEALARRAPVPVLVVKARPRAPYRNVVVATDFSDSSRSALEAVLTLLPDARITLFHAFDVLYETYLTDKMGARDHARQRAQEECRAFLEATPAAAKRQIDVLCEYGDPAPLLRDLAEARGIQLVVLGTAGRSGVVGMLLGSVALRLSTELPADVMLVRRRQTET